MLLAVLGGCTGNAPTGPHVTGSPTDAGAVARIVAAMSDVDLIGQVLMPSVNMSDPAESSAELIRRYHLGGVILMGNVENTGAGGNAAQVRALTDRLRAAARDAGAPVNPIMATDQEYGWVTRIKSGLVQLPSAMALGAAGRPELTRDAWHGAGAELAAAGIDVDFAPDADVVDSPGNTVIGSRSFGSDPTSVATQVAAAVTGLQSAGVAATLKHFPGHGHTTVNSHDALPVLKQSQATLTADDLPPFRAGVDAGAWLVMSGHLDIEAIDPGLPASFSHKVMVDLLRTRLGFTGVTVTDALNMAPAMRWPAGEAAVRAFLAGNDILLMSPDLGAAQQALATAIHSGRIPRALLVAAVSRIIALKLRLASFARPALQTVQAPANRATAAAAAAAAVTVLRGPCSGPLIAGPVRVSTSNGRGRQGGWLSAALTARGVPVVGAGGTLVHLIGNLDRTGDLASGAGVTVAMDTPFLLGSATSPIRVATYSDTQVAMEALADVIAGTARAPGRSPVAVAGLPRSACDS